MEIHLLMAVKDVCAYNLEGDFDHLFRDVEIENSSDAAICAVEVPTAQEIVLDVEAMERSEGEAQGELVPRARLHQSPKSTLMQ